VPWFSSVEAVSQTSASLPESSLARSLRRLWPHARKTGEALALVLAPLFGPILIVAYLAGAYHPQPGTVDGIYFPDGGFLFDLHVMWKAGHDIVIGHSPYPFVYPAPAAFLMVPFGLLPWTLAVVAFTITSVASLVAGLRLLGVRDWRCYGAVLACVPVTSSITIGTLGPLLFLATAAAWRFRDRRLLVAAAVVGVVVTKIFLWPLVIWLIATGRLRTAVTTTVLGIVVVFGSWGLLGFDGLREYPHRIGRVAGLEQEKSFSPFALVRSLGLSATATHVVFALLTILAIAVIVLLARGRDGDRRAFVAAVGAGLALSPIVWLHYLVILFVPIALYRRSLSPAWLIFLAFWVIPGPESGGSVALILATLGLAAGAVALAIRRGEGVPAEAKALASP
jgi:Glycosyltransferase family 87